MSIGSRGRTALVAMLAGTLLLVNLKSAGSLGVAVPQRALEQAVRVIR